MSSSSELDVRRREMSAIVGDINQLERGLNLPEIEGLYDYERMDALDIIHRIERKIRANAVQAAEVVT